MKNGKTGINFTIINHMKYLEEISTGECFTLAGKYFILTADFKRNGDRLAVCLSDGLSKWIKSNDMIDPIDIFTLDKDNNIIAMRERIKDAVNSTTNIS
jgi:hypothetical protein